VKVDPKKIQTFTQFSVTLNGCGTITYILNPSLSIVTIDPVAMTITLDPISLDHIGTYSVALEGTLDYYPNVGMLSVPFTIVVDPCVVTDMSVDNLLVSTKAYGLNVGT
jgi:hypothetical protein